VQDVDVSVSPVVSGAAVPWPWPTAPQNESPKAPASIESDNDRKIWDGNSKRDKQVINELDGIE
jgi:hypothetical protein